MRLEMKKKTANSAGFFGACLHPGAFIFKGGSHDESLHSENDSAQNPVYRLFDVSSIILSKSGRHCGEVPVKMFNTLCIK